MVLIDLIARHALPIAIFTLDTGRLPGETCTLIDRVREHYPIAIEVYYPEAQALEGYVLANGINGFCRSVELRQDCCAIRKTAPLARALAGRGAWITGQRRAQSVTRAALAIEEFDRVHGLPKFNPLADWVTRRSGVTCAAMASPAPPRARLPGIGCAPCTRAIEPGEDVRAGRWWWENPEQKECGLHRRPLDIAVREAPAEAA
jgi:phosphoadenosine phosphosulfate reductase